MQNLHNRVNDVSVRLEDDDMNTEKDNTFLVDTIAQAIKIPGIKVNRNEFLVGIFENVDDEKRGIMLKEGPIKAGFTRDELRRIAKRLVNERTLTSSGISFAAGLPGGIAMAGTIPADTAQFYGIALRLAQEISYLYGAKDLWSNGDVDMEKVTNQLVLYCGVMFGVSGASATLKIMSSALSKQALKKLPTMALTKTIYYPIIKKIAVTFGVKMTKDVFAKGISKVIPVVGGFVSGGLTLASMRPMGNRLVGSFDEACFDYTEQDLENDIEEVTCILNSDEEIIDIEDYEEVLEKEEVVVQKEIAEADFVSKLKEVKGLLDEGVITEAEFSDIKGKLLSKI